MRSHPLSPSGFIFPGPVLWIISILVALGAVVLIGSGGWKEMLRWWQTPEGSHGWVIPFVVGFILWLRRDRIAAARLPGSWWGLPITLAALALLLVDQIGQLHRAAIPATVVMAFGGTLAALGWRAARYVVAPLTLVLFAIAPPGPLYVEVSLQLQLISSAIGAAILRLFGVTVFLDGNVIDLGVYRLQVVEACSGLRYLFPLGFFAFLCAWIYRAPVWAKLLVLFSVVPITILTNSARIAVTGLFVQFGSIEHAEGFMHLFEGWVIFIIALAMLFGLMWALARLRGQPALLAELLDFDRLAGSSVESGRSGSQPKPGTPHPPRPWLACVFAVLVAVPGYALAMNREQTIPERPGLVTFPVVFGAWHGQPWSIEAVLGNRVTDYFLGDFAHSGHQHPVNLWISYHEQQVQYLAGHTPQQCLPGAGWEFVSLRNITAPIKNSRGENFQVNRGIVTNYEQNMIVYYWLEARGEQFAHPQIFKFANLRDSIMERRSDGALVRLITPIGAGETEKEAEARLVEFMILAYPALEPHVGR